MAVLRPASTWTAAEIAAACEQLAARAEGSERRWSVRARYVGQGHELEVPVTLGEDGPAIAARFAETHALRYGFTLPQAVECVALRHIASEPGAAVTFARDAGAPVVDLASGIDAGGPATADVVTGPRSLALPDATLWVGRGWQATALPIGGWRLDREDA